MLLLCVWRRGDDDGTFIRFMIPIKAIWPTTALPPSPHVGGFVGESSAKPFVILTLQVADPFAMLIYGAKIVGAAMALDMFKSDPRIA